MKTIITRDELEKAYDRFCSHREVPKLYSRRLFGCFLGDFKGLPLNLGKIHNNGHDVLLTEEAINKINMLNGPYGHTIVKAYLANKWKKLP